MGELLHGEIEQLETRGRLEAVENSQYVAFSQPINGSYGSIPVSYRTGLARHTIGAKQSMIRFQRSVASGGATAMMKCKRYQKIADQFACFMCEELQNDKHFKKRLKWELRGPTGWNIGSESADLTGYAIKSEKPLVLIEVERRRDAPLSNVGKVWSWVIEQTKKEKLQKPPILIQAFSGRYSTTNTQRKHAELIGKLMQRAKVANYIPISFPYKPRKKAKHCERACQRHARRLARDIIRRLCRRL